MDGRPEEIERVTRDREAWKKVLRDAEAVVLVLMMKVHTDKLSKVVQG